MMILFIMELHFHEKINESMNQPKISIKQYSYKKQNFNIFINMSSAQKHNGSKSKAER